MKEVKAYVRTRVVEQVVTALEEGGYNRMTIIDVSALGRLADDSEARYSIEFVEKHSTMAKIELVCKDADVDRVIQIVQQNACTHRHGDGIIFLAPVERAIRIRNDEEGEQILQA